MGGLSRPKCSHCSVASLVKRLIAMTIFRDTKNQPIWNLKLLSYMNCIVQNQPNSVSSAKILLLFPKCYHSKHTCKPKYETLKLFSLVEREVSYKK
jgi:hypothetical protein